MNEPQQQPQRPVPHPPRPHPGVAAPAGPMSVDPAVIADEVAALLEQVDQLRAATTGSGSVVAPATSMFTSTDTDADGVPAELARLDHQADLLERAHDVLTTSLERLDRV